MEKFMQVLKKTLLGIYQIFAKAFNKYPSVGAFIISALVIISYFSISNFMSKPVIATSGAETVVFTAEGKYNEGTDIKSGNYYVVGGALECTIKLKNGRKYESKSINAFDSYKLSVPKNATIELDTIYAPVTFYTKKDYDKYLKESESKKELSESTTSSSSSSSTAESSTTDSSQSSTETSSSTESSSSTETPPSSSDSDIETTADEFLTKLDDGTLENNKTYKFTGNLVNKSDWFPSDDGYYEVYVSAYDSNTQDYDTILLDATSWTYENLKKASETEFRVKVTENKDFGDYDLRIANASTIK